NELLSNFIDCIVKCPASRALGERLQQIRDELAHEREIPLITIKEINFTSDFRSPWNENDTVYGYLYRRSDAKPRGPGIVMPGFIHGSPMTRALTLLLADKGWSVLEVAVPFFGKRRVATIETLHSLSRRYADLKLTPEDFAGYIEQAVSDVRRASQWFSERSYVDSKRVAISGFSFGGAV